MFYSQFILAKKGPLGTIWIAAHLERKLRKTQVADTDIGLSVDSILFPDVPIALRLSSHLLLGVVRIYSRKVSYLFDDCSEALLKIKQAFRSTAVDLPPEESTAPYHSITLPETFDLDDFELPDNDIFQGNYVDHHVSTKEQITLQDTMDGMVYTTSQFGLDERFGDGDSSQVGLDLEQDMLLDKVTAPCPDEIPGVNPNVSDASPARLVGSFVPFLVNGISNKIEVQGTNLEVSDYAQAPSTPGLVNEPNLSSVQEGLACDDHLDPEDCHLTESVGIESMENTSMKLDLHQVDNATDSLLASHTDCDTAERRAMDTKENDHDSWDLTDKENMEGNLPAEVAVEGSQAKGDVRDGGITNEVACHNVSSMALNGEHTEFFGVRCYESDTMGIGIETEGSESRRNAAIPNSFHSLELPDAALPVILEEAFHKPENPYKLNNHLEDGHPGFPFKSVLQPCSTFPGVLDNSSHGINDAILPHDIPLEDVPCTLGKVEACHPSETSDNIQGEECLITYSVQVEESQMIEPAINADALADVQCDNVVSAENQFEKLDGSSTFELPAPEQLLSVPQMPLDQLDGLLVESLSDKEVLEKNDGASTGAKISGNKRTYTDSMTDMQCLDSDDTFGMSKSKRTVNSIPDDDDLLSSILAGRSSVLKIRPSPAAPEVASKKRVRTASRPIATKRKVLVDDSMVLLGDTIRQQLINTEDIRRLRKKAPCTCTEILIIKRQYLEEDIFHDSVLTGMAMELTHLHGQKFDFSGIEIVENDGNITPFEVEMSKDSLPRPSFGENRVLQGHIEPMTSGVIIEGQQIEPPTRFETKQDEDHVLQTKDNYMDGLSSEHETLCETTDGKIDEAFHSLVLETPQTEPVSGNINDTLSGFDAEATLKDKICVNASLPMNILGMPCDEMGTELTEDISFLGGGISGEGLDGIEVLDHKTDNVAAVASDLGAEEEILLADSKNNKPLEITSDVQANGSALTYDGDTFPDDMFAERLANDTFVNVAESPENIGSKKLGYINEEGGLAVTLGYDDKDKISIFFSGEDHQIDNTNGAGPDRDIDKGSSNDKDVNNLDGHELDQQSFLNAEYSLNNYVKGQCGDFQDVTCANDTGFLNVDDDGMAEDEDSVAGAEDTQLFDNSGWSLRTRAVANYLQNLFYKEEPVYGGNVLSMDNLLTGKTRKEASRMFFETLVLKTKDYIHVEQVKPFDNINIKARAKLIKSDF